MTKKKKYGKVQVKNFKWIYAFLLPTIIIFVMFYVQPIAVMLTTSFTKWDGFNDPSFNGISNYIKLFTKGCIRIHIPKVSVDEKVEIVFEQKLTLNDNHTLERVYDLLNQAQDSNLAKESAYRLLSSGKNLADILGELETTNLKKEIRLAVIEIMTADL